MAEKMRMHFLHDASLASVGLDDLLHASRRERRVVPRLEKIFILWIGTEVALENQAEVFREEDVAVLAAFALIDEDLTLIKVHIAYFDFNQFADTDGRIE